MISGLGAGLESERRCSGAALGLVHAQLGRHAPFVVHLHQEHAPAVLHQPFGGRAFRDLNAALRIDIHARQAERIEHLLDLPHGLVRLGIGDGLLQRRLLFGRQGRTEQFQRLGHAFGL